VLRVQVVVDIGLLVEELVTELLVVDLVDLLREVVEIINQELKVRVEEVEEEVLHHRRAVDLLQVLAVPVSSSSHILHKDFTNLQFIV
jgi:hypothetical protein